MPRKHKKKIRQRCDTQANGTDVTLQEFADASKALGEHQRVKKGAMYALQSQVRSLRGASGLEEVKKFFPVQTLMGPSGIEKEKKEKGENDDGSGSMNENNDSDDDLCWYEKEENDFEIDTKVSDEEQEPSTVEYSDSEKQHSKKISPRKKKCKMSCDDVGVVYPFDIWYRISSYIEPEAVGKFAAICHSTLLITHTANFWRQLYYRYCTSPSHLPECLQPESLDRVHGLRQRVIRALFHSYQPFIERSKVVLPFENEPYYLVGKRCIFMWHERVKNVWNFNFKLKTERLCDLNKIIRIKSIIDCRNFYQSYCDIFDNEENSCYILQVTCQNFQNLPSIMGLVLCNIFLKIGQQMRYHCLRLHFDTNLKESSNQDRNKMGDTVIFLDPVLNIKIFPWWHPKYIQQNP